MRALFDGQLDEGELLARDAFEVGSRLQQSGALQAFVVQTFFIAWQRRALEPLIDHGAPVGGCAEQRLQLGAQLARRRVRERGPRRRGTRRAADVGRRRFRAHRTRTILWLPTLAVAAEAAWTIGEQACARPLRVALAPYIDHNTTLSTALALGPVARPCGLVQILDGDLDGAVATLEHAVTLSREMGSPLWVAESRRALVEALRVRDRQG